MHNVTLKISATLIGLLSVPPLSADSAKLLSKATEQYYQLFETDNEVTWSQAQSNCKEIGGHLATITSQVEQDFINETLLTDINGYYLIGGTDAKTQKKWQWITGEKWGYQNWSKGGDNGPQPNNRPDEDYLLIGPNSPGTDIAWFDVDSTTTEAGYICEWIVNKNIATAVVPDLNKNNANEIAVLWVDYQTGKHTVQIKDGLTKKSLNTLTFATDTITPPQGLISLKDTNGNGISEIGVLYKSKNQPAVLIKDAKAKVSSPLLKTLTFLNADYEGQAFTVSPDNNGNGADEITVIARNKATLASITEMRDSKTGKILAQVGF